MNTLGSNLNRTRTAGLALIALLIGFAIPAAAQAQTPIEDQYAPGETPGGSGGGATNDPDPVPNDSSGGGLNGNGNGGSGTGSGGDESSSVSSGTTDDTVTPIVPTESGTTPPITSTPAPTDSSGQPAQNKAQRDLESIATNAAAEREAAQQVSADANPSTDLLSSDSGGGPGMGIFLWVLLAATLAWAIGSGVIRHRQDGQTA